MSGELEPLARAELRASHEDRDIVVEQLRVAAGDGRIDAEELDQRIEAALNARTFGELDRLVKDLPPASQAASAARRTEVEESQSITVSHGNAHKRGAWLVPRQLVITMRHGNVDLDFTEAVFHGAREVEVVLDTRHGNVRMLVPDGSTVETSGLSVRHGNVKEKNLGPSSPDAIRVVISGTAQHSNVQARKLSGWARRRRAKRAYKALPEA